MKKLILILLLTLFLATYSVVQAADIERGKQLWQQTYQGKAPYQQRSCESCHGSNLTKTGKHVKTNKVIKAMALSANPTRYSDNKKVKKWFYRNCKWTMGRVCNDQEQADILAYLKSL